MATTFTIIHLKKKQDVRKLTHYLLDNFIRYEVTPIMALDKKPAFTQVTIMPYDTLDIFTICRDLCEKLNIFKGNEYLSINLYGHWNLLNAISDETGLFSFEQRKEDFLFCSVSFNCFLDKILQNMDKIERIRERFSN